jgi:hypothetical protein
MTVVYMHISIDGVSNVFFIEVVKVCRSITIFFKIRFVIFNVTALTDRYIKDDKAYLEEDGDAPAYLNYLDEKHIAYTIDRDVHVNHSHPIRNYNNWPKEWAATRAQLEFTWKEND